MTPVGNLALTSVVWVQLANSYGNKVDKLSFDGRHAFVLDNLQNVCASAAQPLRLDDPACSYAHSQQPLLNAG